MSLPVIDIPIKLPFEVPLLVHPIFVHFAIAIPVIVFLLEIANIKARNRAVSVTSLFLMTLALLVYAGAFFAGKADGSNAFALLAPEVQEELKFHKLLGTYLVYAIGVLFVLKLLAMLVKKPWARDFFLAMLLIFIGVLFKQGKDGGELVYKYGVNVEAVNQLQDKVDEMEYEIEDLKKAKEAPAGKATETPAESHEAAPATEGASEAPSGEQESGMKETAPAEESHGTAPAMEHHEAVPGEGSQETAPAEESHEAAPAEHKEETSMQKAAQEAAEEAGTALHEKVQEAAEAVGEAAEGAVEESAEAAHESAESESAAESSTEHTEP
ncbi:DUF2231 domain-containing protein [Hydrogenimonas urashimensis]|uniref:DUF2231 domain-containing protein n=1 Tax=Hydrogenimonas urashimensis TaxID=2740515 RepID=UPI001915AB6D|nr:DUF2231 domain-containing protein [Hydrogenimonas urashimensis]